MEERINTIPKEDGIRLDGGGIEMPKDEEDGMGTERRHW
jgi:hypothetical protein